MPFKRKENPGKGAGTVGVLVPTGTPKPIIDRLNRELHDALASPKIR